MRIRPLFAWYDFWVGLYWDRAGCRLYLLPLPMLGICIEFRVGWTTCSCGERFRTLSELKLHTERSGGLLHGDREAE